MRRLQVQVLPRGPSSHPRSSAEEQPASNRRVEGATPSGDAISSSGPISRGIPLKTGELQVRLLPGGLFNCGAQTGRASRDPVLTGSCCFPNGMGCKSSAFRHFPCFRSSITQSSRLLPGRLRVRVSPGAPISRGRQLTSSGSLAFNQAMRVQLPSPLPFHNTHDRIV
jgi:hypothetical protein